MRRVVAVAALTACAAVAPPAGASGGENPLDRARRAAQRTSFLGVVAVRWREGQTMRHDRLVVQAADGVLMVHRAGGVVVKDWHDQRLVQRPDGAWELLWPAQKGSNPRPHLGGKYRAVRLPAEPVVGRPATLFELFEGSRLRERLHLDAETGLVLRREQYDRSGALEREVGFEVLTVHPPPPPPPVPVSAANRTPKSEPLPASRMFPKELAGGYQRLGIYRRGPLVHALYGDGVYELSVFEQPGRLSHRPGNQTVPVARTPSRAGVHLVSSRPLVLPDRRGSHYVWPGGHVLLWQARHRIYTVVSDAPFDAVLEAVRSLPSRPARPSNLEKLRQACGSLVDPLG